MKIGFWGDTVFSDDIDIDNNIIEKFNSADFNCVNFESCVKPEYLQKGKSRGVCLYSSEKYFELFDRLNIKCANLANNHITDFGEVGISYTLDILNKYGVEYFGAGKNLTEAEKPFVFEKDGERYAFFGFAWNYTGAKYAGKNKAGTNGFYLKKIKDILRPYVSYEHKIAYFHFGTEFEDYPEPYQKECMETLIKENYIDVVIGTHSHCIQGYSCFDDFNLKVCFYSLGNFILPEIEYINGKIKYPQKSKYGYGIIVDFGNNSFEVVPYSIMNNGTKILSNEESIKLIKEYSDKLEMPYKAYRKFYKKNRHNKKRGLFYYNDISNNFIFWFYNTLYITFYILRKTIRKIFNLIRLDIYHEEGKITIKRL